MSDTDDTQSELPPVPIRDPNNEQVKFVNLLGNYGFLNGVCNVTLLTCRYTSEAFGGDVSTKPDVIIGSLLRFDLRLAQELHEALGSIIANNTERPRTQ